MGIRNVLVVNAGSSSLKFMLFDMEAEKMLAKGQVERIGIDNPLFVDGFVKVPDKPGLGIDELNEELIKEHIHDKYPGVWEPTTEWDNEWANDREWS